MWPSTCTEHPNNKKTLSTDLRVLAVTDSRMKFKTVWLWPLIDTLNSSMDWDNLREPLFVTTTVHDVPTIDI